MAADILRQNFTKRCGPEENFGDKHYDDLAKIVEPMVIYEQLFQQDPSLANASYETQFMGFDPPRLHRQFAVTHRERAGHPAPEVSSN